METGSPGAAPPPASASKSGRRFAIGVAIVLGAVIAVNLLAPGIDHAVGGSAPSGVAGSSYGTQGTGLAAAASLFTHYGYSVTRQRGDIAAATLDPAATTFVIEPQTLTADDDAALLQFVSQGGRLVIGGADPFYLRRFRDHPPVWAANGRTSYTDIDPALFARRVDAAGDGAWTDPGSGVVLAYTGDTALITRDRVGLGEIFFVADPSPLENDYLARSDNAALALGLAGGSSRPVTFAEGTHGFGAKRGLGAIPTPWKISLLILAVAAVVLAWSRSRRLGPPDQPARELPPARAEYVRALAVTLERSRDPATALAPMQAWARAHIATRAHLSSDASAEQIDRAAIALGCSEAERAALWYPPTDDNAALVLGRLVSRLSQDERSYA